MDALYLFRHSRNDDCELKFSLRSLNLYLPYIRKVWIFGDKPSFLTDDTSRAEHVPHDYVSWLVNCRTPIANFFRSVFLSSLIPELSFDYLLFCDDYVVLDFVAEQDMRKIRAVEDMNKVQTRGTGMWKESLWRTFDQLKRLNYTGYNFETHTPTYLNKKWVFEAYRDLRDFTTEDRFYGMLGPTAILNHVVKKHNVPLTLRQQEDWYVGFHYKPPTYEEVLDKCRGKRFLNYDDDAYGEALLRFLSERFTVPSIYEKPVPIAVPLNQISPAVTVTYTA